MNEMALSGSTTVMIFIFLGFCLLVLMFFLFWRSVDELKKSIVQGRQDVEDSIGGVRGQLEDLIRVQYEILNTLRVQDQTPLQAAARVPAPSPKKSVPPVPSKGKFPPSGLSMSPAQSKVGKEASGNGLTITNITDFIVEE